VSFAALQVHYNLVHRDEYEGGLAALCQREGLSCIAYSALADGFLTGKYRPGRSLPAPTLAATFCRARGSYWYGSPVAS
jgi:aryl-alcohol dehydrogenase-like predicted oxidoreductase